MKIFFLLCMAISAGFLLLGCADMSKGPATTNAANTSMPPGSSPGLSGGTGGGGGGFRTKHEP